MDYDVCDYRTFSDARLKDEAKYNPTPDLAVALAERLPPRYMRQVSGGFLTLKDLDTIKS